jgi:hypothetical protein
MTEPAPQLSVRGGREEVHQSFSPETLGGATTRMLLRVADGRIADHYGHHWEIGRPLGEWPPPG